MQPEPRSRRKKMFFKTAAPAYIELPPLRALDAVERVLKQHQLALRRSGHAQQGEAEGDRQHSALHMSSAPLARACYLG